MALERQTPQQVATRLRGRQRLEVSSLGLSEEDTTKWNAANAKLGEALASDDPTRAGPSAPRSWMVMASLLGESVAKKSRAYPVAERFG